MEKLKLSNDHRAVLEAVARFGPIELTELQKLVPETKAYRVPQTLKELQQRGFVKHNNDVETIAFYDGDVAAINTDPFNTPTADQTTLNGDDPTEEPVRMAALPDEIPSDRALTLELTEDQTRRFEQMRASVSRDSGTMDREAFLSWLLEMASRFTE